MRMATLLVATLAACASLSAEGRRRLRGGGVGGAGPGGGPRTSRSRRRPAHRGGFSPNIETYEGESDGDGYGPPSAPFHDPPPTSSFYERHGLIPPPLTSRAERAAAGRALVETGPPAGTDPLADRLAQQAKLGLDPASQLRRELLSPQYDRHVYPWDYAWRDQPEGERTGVPVELWFNFHRVFSLDVVHPVMDLVAWLRIEWFDPRLTWRPEEHGNLTKMWFWIGDGGAGGETSEIWTPDIELWNLEEGLRDSFDDAYAMVRHDGSVWWSRPGHLRPVCKYRGLHMFPFDSLTCKMELGSWAHSGKYMRLVRGGETGYTIGGLETAGSTFNEFGFAKEDPIKCYVHVYPPYPQSPEEDWPAIHYDVTVERSWQPFVRGYIIMQILLNVVGFSAFWLPPSCGERMGLSITAMLAAVASEIVIAEDLPAAREFTWFQKFSLLSMGFAFVSLIECVAVLYFYYKRSEDMIPLWFTKVHKWYVIRQAHKRARLIARETVDMSANLGKKASFLMQRLASSDMDNRAAGDLKLDEEVSGRNEPPLMQDELPSLDKTMCAKQVNKEAGDEAVVPTGGMPIDSAKGDQEGKDDKNGESSDDSLGSMGSFDANFGVINVGRTFQDSFGVISNVTAGDDSKGLQSSLKWTTRARRGAREATEESQPKRVAFFSEHENEGDKGKYQGRNKLNLPEPTHGRMHRRRTDAATISSRSVLTNDFRRQSAESGSLFASMHSHMTPRGADDFHDEQEMENNMRWKHVAVHIDQFARFWIPFGFVIALAIVLSEVA